MTRYEILKAVADKADLRGANLREADLRKADLRGANLREADLRDTDLSGAYLRGADLSGAYLRGADLRGADLRGVYLRGADLRGADLREAYLREANLRGADLSGACGYRDAGCDSRGYHFFAILWRDGWRVTAGCRWFTKAVAVAHWTAKNNQDALLRVAHLTREE